MAQAQRSLTGSRQISAVLLTNYPDAVVPAVAVCRRRMRRTAQSPFHLWPTPVCGRMSNLPPLQWATE
jgi:hypothetical protein